METSIKTFKESVCVSYIITVIWEVDFMEDLGAVLLDGVHFDHMGRTLPWVLTEGTKYSDQFIVHTNTDDRQYIQNEARYNTKAQSCRAEISLHPE